MNNILRQHTNFHNGSTEKYVWEKILNDEGGVVELWWSICEERRVACGLEKKRRNKLRDRGHVEPESKNDFQDLWADRGSSARAAMLSPEDSGEMRAESESRRIQIQFLMQREKLSGAEWETNQIKYFLGELLMMKHTFNI